MTHGIGAHQRAFRGSTDEWLTPPAIIKALGPFDLDPCSPVDRPWATAVRHFTIRDNGLTQPWAGRVWLNPPYGPQTGAWLERLANHGDGIALVFARTETRFFQRWGFGEADSMLFLSGRINFHNLAGERAPKNSGAPSVLIAYGSANTLSLGRSGLFGQLVELT